MHGQATIQQLNQAAQDHFLSKQARANHRPLSYDRTVDNVGDLPGHVAVYAEGEKRFEANVKGCVQRFDTAAQADAWRATWLNKQGD